MNKSSTPKYMMSFKATTVFLIMIFVIVFFQNSFAQSGCIPPPDMVVSCKYWFDVSDLDVPSNSTFGRIVGSFASRKKITTRDIVCPAFCQTDRYTGYSPSRVQGGKPCQFYQQFYNPTHPDRKYNMAWGWDGVVESGEVQIEVRDLRDCGIGKILRIFKLWTSDGWSPVATQTIWVLNCDPFYINPTVCTDNTDDIEWPLGCKGEIILHDCDPDLSPENPLLGKPRLANGGGRYCSMVSIDYTDKRFTVEGNSCFKVIRTWTVIDWCQYHPESNAKDGKWTFRQIIKVVNKQDPVIRWDSVAINKRDSVLPDGTCANLAILKISASDDCTEQAHLRYEYKIDLNNDGEGPYGTYDLYAGRLERPGFKPENMDNPYAVDTSTVLDATGYYPLGTHKIKWFVEDGCGNVAEIDSVFVVRDTKAPTPYCKSGAITVIMPSTGSVAIDIAQLNIGSYDNCTPMEGLEYYFNGTPGQKQLVVSCDSFIPGATSLDVPTQVWVEDEAGNTDYCTLTIQVQDPNGVCSDSVTHTISMLISGDDHVFFNDAAIVVSTDDGVEMLQGNIDASGQYNMVLTSSEMYQLRTGHIDLSCSKYPTDRITTRDLILMMKQLLGKEDYTSYQQYIAADVDRSGEITLKDVLMIRDHILGRRVAQLEDNHWVCLTDKNIEISAKVNPEEAFKQFRPKYYFDNILRQEGRHVIFPILLGDIDGVGIRSEGVLGMKWSKIGYDRKGGYMDLLLKSERQCIDGFDMELNLPSGGSFEVLTPGYSIDYNETKKGEYRLVGLKTFGEDPISTDGITLRFYSSDEENVAELLNSSHRRVYEASAYGCDGVTYQIELEPSSKDPLEVYVLPNPLEDNAVIEFKNNRRQPIPIELHIFSSTGRCIYTEKRSLSSGQSRMDIPSISRWKSGVYFLNIESEGASRIVKLVKE